MRSSAGLFGSVWQAVSKRDLGTCKHSDGSKRMGHSFNLELGWGGFRYFKCFKFIKIVTSLQKTAQASHPHPEEKMGCLHSLLAHFHSSMWGKVRKYAVLCSHFVTRVVVFFACESCDLSLCLANEQALHVVLYCVQVSNRCTDWVAFCDCVGLCEICGVCFLHFPFPSLLLFVVMSPTVSLPTRPASLDHSHKEAAFWLQWCVLKNPYMNSVDPPASWNSRVGDLNTTPWW